MLGSINQAAAVGTPSGSTKPPLGSTQPIGAGQTQNSRQVYTKPSSLYTDVLETAKRCS